jgi:hypothetical protein
MNFLLHSALKNEVMPYLNEKQRMRVEEMENELKRKSDQDVGRDVLQAEPDARVIGAEVRVLRRALSWWRVLTGTSGNSEEIGDDGNIDESVAERVQV